MEDFNNENIKESIFDLIYDELPNEKALGIIEKIKDDEELWAYYQQLKQEKDLVNKECFTEVDGFILENAREKLFNKITLDIKQEKKIDLIKIIGKNYQKVGFSLFKYAAIILVTLSVSQHYLKQNKGDGYSRRQSPFIEDQGVITPVAYDRYENTLNLDKYNLSDLNVSRDGDEMTLEFDVSTRKVIKGKQDDPNMIHTLDQIMQDQDNPAIKLRTMKILNKPKDKKLEKSLIGVMLNDDNPAVRRKAFKVLTSGTITDEVKNALMNLIEKDKDSNLKLEALEVLEEFDRSLAKNAVDNASKDSELYKFKEIYNEK